MPTMPYAAIPLTSINLHELKLVKESRHRFGDQDHARWLFKTRGRGSFGREELYYKIWNPTYIRRDHLLRGVESGFYDETTTPALCAVIFAQGVCRGYVMRRCLPNRRRDPVFHARVLEKTIQTGLFAVQYGRAHTMRHDEGFSLVDLEGIHPLDEFPRLTSYYRCVFDDPEYESFVMDLYRRTFPHLAEPQPTRRPPPSSAATKLMLYPWVKARNVYKRAAIRLGTIWNHIDQIRY